MNRNVAFPSKYLKAEDEFFVGGDLTVTIKDVSMQKFQSRDNGGDENKPLMTFREIPKGLILNKTNWDVCEKLFGSPESDDWIGHKIILTVVDDTAFGKPTRAVRIKEQKPLPDKQKLLEHFQKLFEQAKTLKVEGVERYAITPDMDGQTILDLGKELKKKIEAVEAFA